MDDVKISNDIFIIGYPSSLAILNQPQFDFYKPLVKKGSVAGIYKSKNSIILDGSSFGGNSGGPVFGHFPQENNLKLIGVVIQYIPSINELYINNSKSPDSVVPTNSGYTVALSTDLVEEVLDKFKVFINSIKE